MASKLEKSMSDLEKIVTELEKGDMSLDDMLVNFEKGMKLSDECTKILDAAEKKVNILVKNGAQTEQMSFEVEE